MEDRKKFSSYGKKDKPPEIPMYFSGGYGTDQIYTNLGRTGDERPNVVNLLKGSPRDLTALILAKDSKDLKMGDTYLSYTIRRYPSFDKL